MPFKLNWCVSCFNYFLLINYTAMLFQYLEYFVEYQKFALSGAVGSREAEKANASPRPSKSI